MKRYIIIIVTSLLTCITIGSCSQYSNLFKLTDNLVEQIYSSYHGGKDVPDQEIYTNDGKYIVSYNGGTVIAIDIESDAIPTGKHYSMLLDELSEHYSEDPMVEDVYISLGGKVCISVYYK